MLKKLRFKIIKKNSIQKTLKKKNNIQKKKLNQKNKNKNKNKKNSFEFIHIGKCGGTTLLTEFENNKIKFNHIHLKKFKYNPKKKYVIVIRNPIKRFISAFYWRMYRVCDKKDQEKRFKGEKQLLLKYKTINNYAENIYNDKGELNEDFILPKKYIHHIVQDIHYYLGDFLEKVDVNNIKAILLTENLNSDLKTHFNIQTNENIYYNKKKKYDTFISEKGISNLRKFIEKDYKCIDKLLELNLINKEQYDTLTKI